MSVSTVAPPPDALLKRTLEAERQLKHALETFTYRDPVVGPVRIDCGERLAPYHIAVRLHPKKFGTEGNVEPRSAPPARSGGHLLAWQGGAPRRGSNRAT